jgi:hypothetical protein
MNSENVRARVAGENAGWLFICVLLPVVAFAVVPAQGQMYRMSPQTWLAVPTVLYFSCVFFLLLFLPFYLERRVFIVKRGHISPIAFAVRTLLYFPGAIYLISILGAHVVLAFPYAVDASSFSGLRLVTTGLVIVYTLYAATVFILLSAILIEAVGLRRVLHSKGYHWVKLKDAAAIVYSIRSEGRNLPDERFFNGREDYAGNALSLINVALLRGRHRPAG